MRSNSSRRHQLLAGLRLASLLTGALCLIACGPSVPRSDSTAAKPEPSALNPQQVAARSSSLQEAALAGETAGVIEALERGADPNFKSADGRTSLMLAAYGGHTGVMRLLLERGAAVDERDGSGRTALMYAASGPYAESVRLLLEGRADPDLVDREERFTALMFAAAEGQAEVVRALLEHGSDPSLTDVDGDTALDFAAKNGHEEVARMLSAGPAGKNDP